MERLERSPTPLWPAGHLPLEEGDSQVAGRLPHLGATSWNRHLDRAEAALHPISPPEGKVPDRAEGSATGHDTARARR